jgi:hypothetical protein
MQPLKKKEQIPFRWRILKWTIIFLAAYTFIFSYIVPRAAEMVLSKKLSEQLRREVVIKNISLNPYDLTINISGFSVRDIQTSGTLLFFNNLHLNLQIASLFRGGVILEKVILDSPYINVVRNEDNSYNFSDLLEQSAAETGPAPKPFRFSINNIQITGGSADFNDLPKHSEHKARDITLRIPLLSNFPYHVDNYVQPLFKATFNETPVLVEGRTKPFHDSLRTIFNLDLKDLNIPHYLEYVPVKMNFKVLSGAIDLDNTITFTQYTDSSPTVTLTGDINFKEIAVIDAAGSPLVNLPAINISVASSDLILGIVHLSKVLIQSPAIYVMRDKEGKINLESLFPADMERAPDNAQEESEKAFEVETSEILIADGKVIFSDDSFEKTVEIGLEKIEIKGENVSTKKESSGTVSFDAELNKSGSIAVAGAIGINPMFADLKLDIRGISIVPLQPYFTDRVKILVTDGSIATNGSFSFDLKGEELNALFKGEVSLSKFASVDKVKADEFLKWNSLYLGGINVNHNPLSLSINEVALTDFYSRLIINSDNTLNVQGIVKDEKAEPEVEALDERKEINGALQESGPHTANLLEIGGRVSGLSSEESTTADIDLRGKLENYAPLKITGRINPLGDDLFADIKVDFQDMDLSPLTPYSGTYIGRTIQKGKLSRDLQYKIHKKKLDAENRVLLDQFTLGNRVESPDATKLPVGLAIALLKDRNGEINLDLPISGNIDEPEFNVGKIVIKMVMNIFIKAATSPFALLGAIVGGGEELSYVEFNYGSFKIDMLEEQKLNKLIKALSDRPSLKMEIEGYVNIEKDLDALRQNAFDKKLNTQKLKQMIKDGQKAVPIDEVIIGPDEYERFLRKAYKEETFPKPRNALGFAKKLPVPEMEKLILAHIEINDDNLRLLASERAKKVKDYILQSGEIDAIRIFLIEPETLQTEKKGKMKLSRVDFKLK